MRSKRRLLVITLIAGIILYVVFRSPSDEQVAQSLETLLPRLETIGLIAYRNQDWCQVVAYNGMAFSNTNQSTCTFVTDISTSPFSAEASAKLTEISDVLSDANIPVRAVQNIKMVGGKFTFVEFHRDCNCRTRYVFSPGYGTPPKDIANELWHFPIDQNWYRVEEDWN